MEQATEAISAATVGETIHVAGEIDMSTAPALGTLLNAVDGPVLLDMTGVAFMDASGITVLLRHRHRQIGCGSNLRIVAMSSAVRFVLEVTSLVPILTNELQGPDRARGNGTRPSVRSPLRPITATPLPTRATRSAG